MEEVLPPCSDSLSLFERSSAKLVRVHIFTLETGRKIKAADGSQHLEGVLRSSLY